MGNCISIQTEQDSATENVNSVPHVLPSKNELENLPQPHLIKLDPSTTLISSKIISDDCPNGSGVQMSEQTVSDSIQLENKCKFKPELPSNTGKRICLAYPYCQNKLQTKIVRKLVDFNMEFLMCSLKRCLNSKK